MTAVRRVPGLRSPFGLPRLAWMLGRDPYGGLMRIHERYGPVYGRGLGPTKYVFLLGPDANAFVFANSGLFRWREAFDVLVPADGETALIVSDGDDHRRRRRLVQPAFHRRRIDEYVARMAANADAVIHRWQPGQTVNVYADLRRAIRRTTIEVLFGDRLAAEADALGRDLRIVLRAVEWQYGAQKALRTVPNPIWRRVVQARGRVIDRIDEEIARRRADGEDRGDILAMLLAVRDEDDGALTDVEIHDQVISLIVAGYETTSAALAWAVHELLGDDAVRDRAREEVAAVFGERVITGAGLPELTFLDRVVAETLRLHPPAVISARKAAEAFEFGGHRIPAGSIVLFSPYVTHRLPGVWPDPESFRPDRWDRDDPDHRPATPATYLPFGGGPHRCIGAAFATVEITAMLAQLLRRVELSPAGGPVTPTSVTAMRPRGGLLARVDAIR